MTNSNQMKISEDQYAIQYNGLTAMFIENGSCKKCTFKKACDPRIPCLSMRRDDGRVGHFKVTKSLDDKEIKWYDPFNLTEIKPVVKKDTIEWAKPFEINPDNPSWCKRHDECHMTQEYEWCKINCVNFIKQ